MRLHVPHHRVAVAQLAGDASDALVVDAVRRPEQLEHGPPAGSARGPSRCVSICLRMTSLRLARSGSCACACGCPRACRLRILAPLRRTLHELAAVDEERALDVAGAQDVGDLRAGRDVPAVVEGESHGTGGARRGLDHLGRAASAGRRADTSAAPAKRGRGRRWRVGIGPSSSHSRPVPTQPSKGPTSLGPAVHSPGWRRA